MTFAARTLGNLGPNFGPISGNLTAATFNVTSSGYNRTGPAAGTMSPSSFPAGQVVDSWYDVSGVSCGLTISGFTSDPTKTGFFTTATYNSVSATAASSTYGYNPGTGVASWTWTGVFGFASNISVSKTFSIT